ncbi:type VII secretion protein EccB [Actinoallomurus purpureus]|uniref:type VII secretion protein EccB n=1 Tax=Actinoallomurus purpureus TaxID=478114 RepID=UPI002092A36B|nr:type VII secretion protein EccB [Actinoallomurus purpureus]MCO6011608.1 type VII secretion protein EccB [Actinoallomurus purpureus]
MQTRRDLYQAHKLMMQRVGLALLQGEPDVAESPMRRPSVAAFSGAMVAVLIAAVFGVIGFISPSGAKGLDQGGTVIIERETGTKYVYDTNRKRLLPVLNYASAKLALDSGNSAQRVVSRKSLAKFTRGPMIGIPGAPDSLPDPNHLVKKPWSVCVRNGTTTAGGTRSVTSLVAGSSVGGRLLGAGQAVVVQAGGQSYVIWNNQRMHMTLPPAQAGSVTRVQPAPVSQTWLNPLDQGADFVAPPVGNRGGAVPGVDGSVGQVFKVPSGAWYVLLSDGFAQITETQGILLLAEPQTKENAYHGQAAVARDTDFGTVTSKPSTQHVMDARLPQTMPDFVPWDASTPLCAVYADMDKGSVSARLSIGGSLPDVDPTISGQGTTVDQVILPPGGAALVGLLPAANELNAINSWYIVNDAGVCFPLSSKDTAQKLGYNVNNAAPIPKGVQQLMPTGPTLDPTAARKPAPAPKANG